MGRDNLSIKLTGKDMKRPVITPAQVVEYSVAVFAVALASAALMLVGELFVRMFRA